MLGLRRSDENQAQRGQRLSGRSAGQNRFLKYHNAVLLNVVNFSPDQYVMLHSVGLTDAEIYRAQAHNVAYQDLLRGSMRMTGVRDAFNGIVIDRATALDIGGEFPGCSLHQLPDAPKRAGRKRPGPAKKAGSATRCRAAAPISGEDAGCPAACQRTRKRNLSPTPCSRHPETRTVCRTTAGKRVAGCRLNQD